MRITREADYAIRVMYSLAAANCKLSARQIAELTEVTPRFVLKILRKLILADMVQSFKGMNGGYILKRPASEISLGQIIEIIDGPIAINYCLSNEFDCAHHTQQNNRCCFQQVFSSVNDLLRKELHAIMLSQFI